MPSKKIVFLDRDGVINKKADEHCYITKVEDFIFNDGIFEAVLGLQKKGFEFIILTNQRGIARGLMTIEKLFEIHKSMNDGFLKHGIKILDVFYCPHDINSCECRKPKDGMLRMATHKYAIDLGSSLLISDSPVDIEMGKMFGVGKNILIESDNISNLHLS